MENIIELANELKYTSLKYVDEEDISDGKVFINSTYNIFIYKKTDVNKTLYWNSKTDDNIQVFWASGSKEKFFQGLKETINHIKETETKTEKIFIEFIPEEFLEDMSSIGFKIVTEWVDFWSNDLTLLNVETKRNIKLRKLRKDEASAAGQITRNCLEYSRGFTGESDEAIQGWFEKENSSVFVAEAENKLVGVCIVNLYGFNSEKGTILWIRELAVEPNYQGKGVGHELLAYAIKWGIKNGAKRSFLACDAENINAIKLYQDFNYKREDKRGQINMEIKL